LPGGAICTTVTLSAPSSQAANSSAGFDTSNLESKLDGYLLDPAHPQNQTKANWFDQALTLPRNDVQQEVG
jgi:filamentous hemagglutinin